MIHKEGELYGVIDAFGASFEIRYGYYEDYERESGEPIPIYPDFLKYAQYTEGGMPFVTAMQDMCEHGEYRLEELTDECCGNCRYFKSGKELIGACTNEENKFTGDKT